MNDQHKKEISDIVGDYKYGFKTEAKTVVDTGKGLSEEVVRKISELKGEPDWMLEFRLKAYHKFVEMEQPNFGPNLDFIDFNDYTYYIKSSEHVSKTWDDVPEEIKDTFEKLGIPEAERDYLAGVTTQFESEAVYHHNMEELEKQGVLFCDTDTALKKYPEIFKKYFATIVPYTDNKYAALNSAVWSGGSFIYIPKGVKLEKPLQSYFRINSEQMGQFERSLIIVDKGASVHYVEGCTAPIYSKDSLHAAVVEIYVADDASCRYSTIQNWANNVYNLVTKRALVDDNGTMEWIDGNIGSKITMKYPACILKGDNSKGTCITISVAGSGQIQDTGARMIHLGKNTKSNIVSKSIARGGGNATYRGKTLINSKATNSEASVKCDTLILDKKSKSDTIPTNSCFNKSSIIEHEATVSKISEDNLFYLMSRGISHERAMDLIILGFIEKFREELPMEYAVELNQLIKRNL